MLPKATAIDLPEEKPAAAAESSVALRDFFWTLVRTDFQIRYHGTLGGFGWALLKPLAMFVVLYKVFSFIFPQGTYALYLLTGLLLWSFFSEGTAAGLESLLRKGFLLSKASFPRWVVVVASLANALLTLLVFSIAIIIAVSVVHKAPGPLRMILFVWYLVQYFFIVLGFSLGASVLFLEYRDLNQVWDLVLQTGFFFAPIIYQIDIIPERYHFALYVWPVTPIIQFSRSVLITGVTPSLNGHLYLFGVTVFIFGGGAFLFKRLAARAVEKL